MGAVDTHIHLDLLEDLAAQLSEAKGSGITRWVVPGVCPDGWQQLQALAENHPGVFFAPGVHPQAAGSYSHRLREELSGLLAHPRAVAIGEVGLDRQVEVDMSRQEELFVEMIHLAKEHGKPLLIHARKSTERILELLEREGGADVGGIFHAFSGSLETARRIAGLGFMLGIGGVVTWPTAKRLPEVVRNIPSAALVVETDAPFMTPVPYQGEPNRPVLLSEIIKKVAEIREVGANEVNKMTAENANRLFKLSDSKNRFD